MILKEVHFIYFSPTHTSKQVGEAIVRGVGITNVAITNLTLHSSPDLLLSAEALAVIVVPVYGGHVAPLAMERLQNIRGMETPVVLAVVYGNRAYEKSLMELDAFVLHQGFKVIAGATFIGEHSYSNKKYPISAGRPDKDDLSLAEDFGKKIRLKIESAEVPEKLYAVDVRTIRRPKQPFFPLFRFLRKVIAFRKSGVPLPKTPWVENPEQCTHCGSCVAFCPAGAILKGDELHTDADKCIKCCACVKRCPQKARVYDTPFAELLSTSFTKQKEPRVLL